MITGIQTAFGLLLTLAAAADGPTKTVRFDDAVRLVIDRNADLRAAVATYHSTAALEGVARAGYLPTVSGNIGYSSSGGTQAAPGAVDQNGSYTAAISATENIFNGLQTVGQRSQAQANTRAALATLATTKARIGYDLTNAFAGVVFARESLKLNEDIIHRREENLRLVTLRFQSGRENQGSVLLSQAYLEQARYDHLQSRDNFRVYAAQLARALGLDDAGLVTADGDVPTSEPSATVPAFTDLVAATPDYQLARAQEESAAAGVTIARGGFFPQLSVTASDSKYGPDFFPEQRERWSVGATITLPFFNGGRDYYNLRAAAETRTANELARANASRQLLAKLEQSWATYIESVAKLKVDDSFRKASGLRAEIARKKYNNGLQTFDDWDVIENDLITRQKNYLQSKLNRATAEAAWNQGLGKGVLP